MICQVFCGLSDAKLRDKIIPLTASQLFKGFRVFRNSSGPAMSDVTYHSVPHFFRKSPRLCVFYKFLSGLLFSFRRAKLPSLVLSFFCVPHGFIAYLVAKLTQKRLVTCLVGSDINVHLDNPFLRPFILTICRSSLRTIVTGSTSARKLTSFGLKNVRIVRNTIDISQFAAVSNDEKRERKAIFVGRLDSNKRVDRFIQLIWRINDMGLSLDGTVLGDGNEKDALELLVKELNIRERVHFLGHRNDVPAILRTHKALCLFSENEGMPAVLIEALCTGMYVLAVGVGDIPDIKRELPGRIICRSTWDLEFFAKQLSEILVSSSYTGLDKHVRRFRHLFSYENGGNLWRLALDSSEQYRKMKA